MLYARVMVHASELSAGDITTSIIGSGPVLIIWPEPVWGVVSRSVTLNYLSPHCALERGAVQADAYMRAIVLCR